MKIKEFRNILTKNDTSLTEMLRIAKFFAKKVKDEEIVLWIDKELNGYEKDKEVPDYRMVKGQPKAWNPYHGWIPWIIDNPETQKKISQRGVNQRIGEIENLIRSDSNNLQMPYPEEAQKQFSEGLINQFTLIIPKVALIGITESIRNKLIDWTMSLSDNLKISLNENREINYWNYVNPFWLIWQFLKLLWRHKIISTIATIIIGLITAYLIDLFGWS
jgi:hypothetical protein